MHRGGIGAARVERGLLQRAAADQLPHELTGMEVNMWPVGCVGGAMAGNGAELHQN